MTKRFTSLALWVLLGAFLIYALSRDYLLFVASARSLWWFALEILVVATVFASLVLLDRHLPRPDLETVTGGRAAVGVVVVLVAIAPAVVAGAYLDELLGLYLSFGSLLASTSVIVALRLVGARLSPTDSTLSPSASSSESIGSRSASTPPN